MNDNLKNEINKFYNCLDMDLPDEANKVAIDLIPKLVREIFNLEHSMKILAQYYRNR